MEKVKSKKEQNSKTEVEKDKNKEEPGNKDKKQGEMSTTETMLLDKM